MQQTSSVWKEILSAGNWILETSVSIGGTEYDSTSAPVITRGTFPEGISVGNCIAAELSVSVLTDDDIPRSSEVKVNMRLRDDETGLLSEWLPAGTFYITKRRRDYSTGLVELECFDAMLKAQQSWFAGDEEIIPDLWPKSMSEIVYTAASRMGIEVDEGTVINTGSGYTIPAPKGLTILEVLGYIAGVHGGNWVISPSGKLRLVPLAPPPDPEDEDSIENAVTVNAVLSKLTAGAETMISCITMKNGDSVFTSGDDSGYELSFDNPYACQDICDDLYDLLSWLVYRPFAADGAIYDPAAEPGDPIIYHDILYGVLINEKLTLNTAFRSDISAPDIPELEDEYPYLSSRQRDIDGLKDEVRELKVLTADKADITEINALYAAIESLSVSDIRTGIIRSSDYSVTDIPALYPDDETYPQSALYPSNGEQVLTGFAIDFSSGMIYGAFYSSQIAALAESVSQLRTAVTALQNSLTYPKSNQ